MCSSTCFLYVFVAILDVAIQERPSSSRNELGIEVGGQSVFHEGGHSHVAKSRSTGFRLTEKDEVIRRQLNAFLERTQGEDAMWYWDTDHYSH